MGRSVMPGRAGRWDGSLTRRPARRPSGVAVWGFCKSLDRLPQWDSDLPLGEFRIQALPNQPLHATADSRA
ncbi:MAG: hypothetical protein ACOX7Q_17370, partial [Kiritimatiellia bacterium]